MMAALLLTAAATPLSPIALSPADVRTLLGDTSVTGAAVATGPIRLAWAGPVQLGIDAATDETVVRFDRPQSDVAIAAFRRNAAAGLGLLEWNDASLVLRPAQGWTMQVTAVADSLLVTLAPRETAAADDTDSADTVAYGLAAAASDGAAGYPGRAWRTLVALDRKHPGDPHISRAMADAELASGARRRAGERYRALHADDPFARAALREAGGESAVEATLRSGSGFAQTEVTARALLPVSRDVMASAALRTVMTRADTVVVPGGVVRNARPTAVLVDAGASMITGNAVRIDVVASAALQDTRVGFRGRFSYGPAEQEIRFAAAYHIPDLTTAEAALLAGYLDRLAVGATWRLAPATNAQFDVGLNGYGLTGEGRRATSITIAGGLEQILLRRGPAVSLLYRLDAEYVERLDRRGSGAAVLPLVDRENHTVQALVAGGIGSVRLAGAAGWTFDRFGPDGPTATATATVTVRGGWRAEASGGVTSISRPNVSGTQLFGRALLVRALGRP